MDKIDIYNMFFNSPNWSYRNRYQLDEFRAILQSGYILSPKMLGRKPNFPELSEEDKVYLSVHPNGKLAKRYTGKHTRGKDNESDYANAYGMTIRGQYLILDSKLKRDYKIERGEYDCECTVLNQIELYKHLVGIGNAGYYIKDDFILCYNFIRYFNGEIDDNELLKIIKDSTFYSSISGRIWTTINCYFNPRNYDLKKQMHNPPEYFVEIGNYYNILMILNELKKDIPLYDKYGRLIVPKNSIEEARMMHEYISSNLDDAIRGRIYDAMDELSDRLDEKCKRH